MAEDASPPPPPPLSPPTSPALEATTIGKYIARFRHEKPQPREARAAAQRSDFWWTKSPRYARSPPRSPPRSPSTWALSGVFSFPQEEEEEEDDEINEEMTKERDEKDFNIPQEEDGDSSVDSVESKLRRRLGVWGGDSSREGDVVASSKSVEVLQSWGLLEWSSVDLEEEAEEAEGGEDPEQVIERVRRRLGWAVEGAPPSTSGLKPIEFRLSIEKREQPRGRKPPLSPGLSRRGDHPLESLAVGSTLSWGSTEREREFEEETKSSSVASAGGASGCGVDESPVGRSEGGLDGSCGRAMSSAEGGDAKSFHTGISSLDLADKGLRSSGLSVGSSFSQEHEPVEGRCEPADDSGAISINDHAPTPRSDELSFSENCETKEERTQSQAKAQELSLSDQVPELPLLQTASPARPESALDPGSPSTGENLSGRSHDSSASSRGQGKLIPTETTKTLDSLVSLVVHSWEHDIFSDPSSELLGTAAVDGKHEDDIASVKMPNDKPLSVASTPTQPSENQSDHPQGSSEATDPNASIQDSSTVASADEIYQATSSLDNVKVQSDGVTQLELDDDDEGDCEVPGEEDDQIVQMLLERIALLEEALRQMDS
ncbi:hypothetical protein PF010_g3871 [Phytophthora fragariae]|uniref:Uncharacterized protein n=1 Tax=Phytophthora fragariae TaxID=53985 RepID=A0A6G0LUG8_9STRA|nr:hypothetical protein PF010_g3871 [Phytophthora fragariae]